MLYMSERKKERVMCAIFAAHKLDTIYGAGFARENARNFWPRNPTPSLRRLPPACWSVRLSVCPEYF